MDGAGLTLARVVAFGGEEKVVVVLQDVDLFPPDASGPGK
jgi:hypothetical protein